MTGIDVRRGRVPVVHRPADRALLLRTAHHAADLVVGRGVRDAADGMHDRAGVADVLADQADVVDGVAVAVVVSGRLRAAGPVVHRHPHVVIGREAGPGEVGPEVHVDDVHHDGRHDDRGEHRAAGLRAQTPRQVDEAGAAVVHIGDDARLDVDADAVERLTVHLEVEHRHEVLKVTVDVRERREVPADDVDAVAVCGGHPLAEQVRVDEIAGRAGIFLRRPGGRPSSRPAGPCSPARRCAAARACPSSGSRRRSRTRRPRRRHPGTAGSRGARCRSHRDGCPAAAGTR